MDALGEQLPGRVHDAHARLEYAKVAPGAIQALRGLDSYVRTSGLEPALVEPVKVRSSQINGCAYCIDMHTKDARAEGESEQRLYALPAWREAPFFTQRERAALEWAEALTAVAEGHVPDDVYEHARRQFTEKELVDLAVAVAAINAWNRIAVSFRAVAGSYQPKRH
ncbi:MAG TPA: carboxymuconolactone decarboxylase family protein [Thermoanaerobaculaceae bacterium]|nr:carboxymuconolactone decarboxylase family protein [Thermoanaerobaculaceae bacterium]